LAKRTHSDINLSKHALAKAIGVPQIRVSEIVNNKRAITPDTALRFARARSCQHLFGMY
jgi:addiction module HigA family antidote